MGWRKARNSWRVLSAGCAWIFLDAMNHPDTYYSRTAPNRAARSPLTEPLSCDTVVIGGGLAGMTTALELARHGQAVVLIEAGALGHGASGRNGGFVSPGFATDSDLIARRVGREAADALHRLSIEGMGIVRQEIESLGMTDAGLTPGLISVLRYSDREALEIHARHTREAHAYPLQVMGTEEVRSLLHSTRYFQALYDPQAFHIHPLNYLLGLARAFESLGGLIFEKSPALSTEIAGAEKKVLTAGGSVAARHIVVATGGYTGPLFPRLRRASLPIATYVMVSEEAPELIASAIATRAAVGDDRRAGDYYRLVDGGRRLLWGGRITTRPASTTALVRELRAEMTGTYPQLAGLRTELAWSGLMSYARHLMPQIREFAPGVWCCTAFGGHGLNTTAIGGRIVAEAILGMSDRHRHFHPFGLSWAGGMAGLAVAQLTYWKLQAEDWWRERGNRHEA